MAAMDMSNKKNDPCPQETESWVFLCQENTVANSSDNKLSGSVVQCHLRSIIVKASFYTGGTILDKLFIFLTLESGYAPPGICSNGGG